MRSFVGRWICYLFHTKHAPVFISVGPIEHRKAATISADVSANQRLSRNGGCDKPVRLALKRVPVFSRV